MASATGCSPKAAASRSHWSGTGGWWKLRSPHIGVKPKSRSCSVGQTIVFCGLPACAAGARSSRPEGVPAEQLEVAANKRLPGDSKVPNCRIRLNKVAAGAHPRQRAFIPNMPPAGQLPGLSTFCVQVDNPPNRSLATLRRYIREGRLFLENATAAGPSIVREPEGGSQTFSRSRHRGRIKSG